MRLLSMAFFAYPHSAVTSCFQTRAVFEGGLCLCCCFSKSVGDGAGVVFLFVGVRGSNIIKPSVLNRLGRRDSLRRVQSQHAFQQIAPVRSQRRQQLNQWLRPPLGELMPIPQIAHLRPCLRGWRSHHTEDRKQLLNLTLPAKDRPAAHHFRQNAPHAPHVQRRGVNLRAQQNLRRAIPKRDHLVRVFWERNRVHSPKPKVRQLNETRVLCHQQILRLEVTVHDGICMAVAQPEQNLQAEPFCRVERQRVSLSVLGYHELLEIVVDVLKHQVQQRFPAARLRVLDVEQRHDVRRVEGAEDGHLTQRRRWHAFIVAC
mmetsp:Transcript_4788/g.10229  ORF Transcript_4788/g.10229 Transcript_4788/m.10229 type:complete len:316 (+) Transcript_4788:638-1585(+)